MAIVSGNDYKKRVIKRILFGAVAFKQKFWNALGEIILVASESGSEEGMVIDRAIFTAEEFEYMHPSEGDS